MFENNQQQPNNYNIDAYHIEDQKLRSSCCTHFCILVCSCWFIFYVRKKNNCSCKKPNIAVEWSGVEKQIICCCCFCRVAVHIHYSDPQSCMLLIKLTEKAADFCTFVYLLKENSKHAQDERLSKQKNMNCFESHWWDDIIVIVHLFQGLKSCNQIHTMWYVYYVVLYVHVSEWEETILVATISTNSHQYWQRIDLCACSLKRK